MSSTDASAETTGDSGRLLVDEPAPGVTRLTISNPDKRGALDHAILDAFAAMMPELDARCVLITGEGRMFSAGYDIGDLPDSVFADEAEKLIAHPFTAAIDAIEAYPYPTLAAMNGHAIGGGLELAISCDMRMSASGISLGMPPAKLGLVYSHTGIRKFIDTIGAARTRELFLGGHRIDASTALTWGLVNSVVEPEHIAADAVRWAAEIAGNAPLAQLGNKRVIREVLEAHVELSPEVEAELIELRRACFSSEDFREGVRAFAEKRAAGVARALTSFTRCIATVRLHTTRRTEYRPRARQPRRETGVHMTQVLDALERVDVLLDKHVSLQDIEADVARLHLPDDAADVVWLYAWAEQERRAHGHHAARFDIACPP